MPVSGVGKTLRVIDAKWPAPKQVRAFTSLRTGGVSTGVYASLNLAEHVGDDGVLVRQNRERLVKARRIPSEPVWLLQEHGTHLVEAANTGPNTKGDGSVTDQPGVVCAVLTADCLPLFLCDEAGARVAIAHVGWRGLAAGIVEGALAALGTTAHRVLAWLGPAIGPRTFEIGESVKTALSDGRAGAQSCFTRSRVAGNWFANLYALVRERLHDAGVVRVYCDESLCTFSQPQRFFSYRRSGRCGRMASVIWIER